MRFVQACLLFSASILFSTVSAMDGVCISTILGTPSYKWWMVPGKLVKYEIRDDHVVDIDTLNDIDAGSPRINMSGTYYAYIQLNGDFNTRKLVIKPLYGNPQSTWETPMKTMPSWLWWLTDGSFLYSRYVDGSQNEIRKITLSGSGGNVTVTDRMWAKVEHNMQGGFIGIDGTGTKLVYSDGLNGNGGFIMDGDSTQTPQSVNINNGGCGYSVSPSGVRYTQWRGGHNATSWTNWDGSEILEMFPFTRMVDSGWVVTGPDDPEGKLEIMKEGVWIPNPIGVCGADNVWAQNSEYWHICEIAVGSLPIDANGYNAIALSWKWKKAINITKIMPVQDGVNWTTEFQGIDRPTGAQMNADHPTLWCSNVEDVSPDLWHYIDERDTDNQYWSDLLGLPLSEPPTISARPSHNSAHKSANLSAVKHARGHTMQLSANAPYTARVFDIAGHTIAHMSGNGATVSLEKLAAGTYIISIHQSGNIYKSAFVAQ